MCTLLRRLSELVRSMSRIFPFVCVGAVILCIKPSLKNSSRKNCYTLLVLECVSQLTLRRLKSPIMNNFLTRFLRSNLVIALHISRQFLIPSVPTL